MELINVETLSADELAKARDETRKLEKRAYDHSKDRFAQTAPAQRLP